MSNIIKSQTEWLESRKHGVGSSDSPVLALGEIFKKTPLDLYINKKAPIEKQKDNTNFRRGHTYEPLAIALAEEKLGMKIHAPKNDNERWNDYKVKDPTRDYVYADFDGVREDGWVVEVKSPLQRIAEQIQAKGLKAYYQIQGQHLVHVASTGDMSKIGSFPRECPGVCFVIYEPELVQVQIYEIPRNDVMISAILANAKNFWENHVLENNPPTEMVAEKIETKSVGAKYQEVTGPSWDEAVTQLTMADETFNAAKNRLELSKARIQKAMTDAGLGKIITESGYKFQYIDQNGRKSFDLKKLKADYPFLKMEDYEKQGKPFKAFRKYGPKDAAKWGDETLDGQLLTLKDELDLFSKRKINPEIAVEYYDELRIRTEMYLRMLALEQEGLKKGVDEAREALVKKIQEEAQK